MIRVAILWLVLALPLAAQDLPEPMHTSVNDYAGVLNNADIRALDQALIALNQQTGVEGTVVTMTDRARYGGSDGLAPFATRLFNHWGVGDAARNDGFMVLLLVDDREARIELGAGYPAHFNQIATRIVETKMVPHFRAGNYSAGMRAGTEAAITQIARPHVSAEAVETVAPDLAPAPTPKGAFNPTQIIADLKKESWLSKVFPYLFGGLFLLIGGYLATSLLRPVLSRNKCPSCGARGVISIETPISQPVSDGSGSVLRSELTRSCPHCGWSQKVQQTTRTFSTYSTSGAFLGAAGRGSDRDRDRYRSDRDRGGRGGGGGGFGGGSSSGGGGSGKW